MQGNQRIIDLTRPIEDGQPGVRFQHVKTLNTDGWNATKLELYSHSGTHMDAPWHFEVSPLTIDRLPLRRLMDTAFVLDFSSVNERHLMVPDDFGPQMEQVGDGSSILIRTGWSERFGTPEYRDALPRVSEELVEWMRVKKINMLGVEPPSVADVNNLEEVTHIHQLLMRNDIVIIEGLVNLHLIHQKEVTLMAFPLNIKDGDGSPARVFAIEDD